MIRLNNGPDHQTISVVQKSTDVLAPKPAGQFISHVIGLSWLVKVLKHPNARINYVTQSIETGKLAVIALPHKNTNVKSSDSSPKKVFLWANRHALEK